MNLYCCKCRKNHKFDLLNVEVLVYGLQASFADQQQAPDNDELTDDSQSAYDKLICLEEALKQAADQELWGDHSQQLVINRYAHEIDERISVFRILSVIQNDIIGTKE